MAVRELAIGAIATVVIGGGTYTINKTDVVDNFASDTGLSKQEADQYVSSVKDDDLMPYGGLGTMYVNDGNEVLSSLSQIDCVNYKYDWETPTLSCQQGKDQLTELGNGEIALGGAYKKLGSDSASKSDIADTVALLDRLNADYTSEIVGKLLDSSTVDKNKKSNSYNKATLQAALKNN